MAAHPVNPDYVRFVTETVLSMPAAARLGFRVGWVAPGEVELRQPWRHELTQHDGHLQAGVLASLADLAAGCAAGTLLPVGWVNMTVDITLKILAPASGAAFLAHGRVVNAGLTTTIAAADVWCLPTTDGATDLSEAHGDTRLNTAPGAGASRSRADDAIDSHRPGQTMCATALITFRNIRRRSSHRWSSHPVDA
ncbi:PaaI family thioesterase [Frankia sp. AiPs1]|uniref:PaaI family thioesterase n=1 Tax=Frankia sp. AiPs1 TaxID=573493 RepID=UPI0020448100|nr:PaaI family thioesterase [Frankia sp. AiPs1]MCM3923432.1 PaaI family thioesterase [Frankia sp. AiPs1]